MRLGLYLVSIRQLNDGFKVGGGLFLLLLSGLEKVQQRREADFGAASSGAQRLRNMIASMHGASSQLRQ